MRRRKFGRRMGGSGNPSGLPCFRYPEVQDQPLTSEHQSCHIRHVDILEEAMPRWRAEGVS